MGIFYAYLSVFWILFFIVSIVDWRFAKQVSFWLVFFLTSLVSAIGSAAPRFTKNRLCIIIHSYNFDYAWTKEEDAGIVKAMQDNFGELSDWEVVRYFLDSKVVSGNKLQENIDFVRHELAQSKPDAVVLTDDLAVKEYYSDLVRRKINLGVTGINGKFEDYGYSPNDRRVTGSLERYNLPPSIKILKEIRPTLNSITFISDDSITGRAMLMDYLVQINQDNFAVDVGIHHHSQMITNNYNELKSTLIKLDPSKTILVLVSYYSFRDADRHIDYNEIDAWVKRNTKLLDVGSSTFQIQNGRLLSLASSGHEIGYFAAHQLFKAIKEGNDPAIYPIRQHLPLRLVLNDERAREIGIVFPFEILAYAKTTNDLYFH